MLEVVNVDQQWPPTKELVVVASSVQRALEEVMRKADGAGRHRGHAFAFKSVHDELL